MTRTQHRHSSRVRSAAGLAALGLVVLPLIASAADLPADPAPTFQGNFEVDLVATPLRGLTDRPFLFNPVVNAQLFPSSVQLSSVGARLGSASLVGIGAAETAGGLLPQLVPGSLNDVIGLVQGVPGLLALPLPAIPLPELPPVPFPAVPLPAVPPLPNTVNTNFPFTADAKTGVGPIDGGAAISSTLASAESHARANSVVSTATAGEVTSGLLGPTGLISVGGVMSESESEVRADDVRGTATSTLSDINVLGLITIGSIKTVTTVTGNGEKSSSTSTVTVGKVTALGYPATIDANGVSIAGNGLLPESIIATLNGQLANLLKTAGLSVTLAKQTTDSAKADATTKAVSESAGVKIDFATMPPDAIPVLGGTTTKVEIALGFSRGSISTGPTPTGAGSTGTTGAGNSSGASTGASTGPSSGTGTGTGTGDLGGTGLSPDGGSGLPDDSSTSGEPPVVAGPPSGNGAPSTSGGPTALDQAQAVRALSNNRLLWATIWPLLLALSIVVTFLANASWARGGIAARIVGQGPAPAQ